ncbi:hypothetical protein DSO57_1026851, partial [Entomophthora muscae]
ANTGALESTLEALESNPDPPKTTQVTQSGQETSHLLNCIPELTSYSKTCQSPKDNSPNGHQIDDNLEPPKTQTYAEVAACLKEVKTKPIFNSANDHYQLPAFCPERVVQLNYSGDIVNSGSRTKHCHFYSPEQALPGSPALETLSQDPCPTSALSANLNPAKIKEENSHGIKTLAFYEPLVQTNLTVRIDNSPPLEPQAQERELNPEPGFPRAARPMDCGTTCPHFSGVEPPQADAEDDGPSSETDQAKEIIALSGVPITTPNGGNQATTISFMSLKSTPATNQEPTQGRGTGPQPGPMTTTL